MMNIYAILFLLLPGLFATAQNKILTEVEQQVWFPFMKALAEKDSAVYASLHHPSVIRISNDRNGVYQQGKDYYNYIGRWFASAPEQSIDFRFTERTVSETIVSEQGYYKYSYTSTAGERKLIYGKFHVISTLTANGWKILMDYDYTNQEQRFTVTNEDFEKAQPFISN